jgi:hypothetical protein
MSVSVCEGMRTALLGVHNRFHLILLCTSEFQKIFRVPLKKNCWNTMEKRSFFSILYQRGFCSDARKVFSEFAELKWNRL